MADKCKEKKNAYNKQYYQDNREEMLARQRQYDRANKENKKQYYLDNIDKRLKTRYGINSQEYAAILDAQDGCCPICLKHHTEFTKKLAVDHIHDRTGCVDYNKGVAAAVRGLLCDSCNKGLGILGDSMDNLIRAIGYKMANDLCPFTLTKRQTHEED